MPGKIDASLKEEINNVEWGKYKIGDLFKVSRGLSMYVKDKESFTYVQKNDKNAIRLVQQMKSNNGIVAYVDKTKLPNKFKLKIEKPGQITINPDQPLSYYQDNEFIGNSVIIIDTSNLSKNVCLYIVAEIQRIRRGSTWNEKFPKEQVKNAEIMLPCHKGIINFEFMEKLIKKVEIEHVQELEDYLKISGLDNLELTIEEKNALENYNNIIFEDFDITSIFKINNTKNILSRDIVENSGDTPYLCASSENNAVSSYIKYDERLKDKGNCIFIGGKTFVVSYQEKDFYSNDSHNLVLYLKNHKVTKLNQLYLVTCVNKSLSHKYSWGDSISGAKIKSDIISLPTKDGKPDYDTMETLISAIQKLVMKDVVLYAKQKNDIK